ncbi:hypothetical protein L249_2173 [Ophiocordyceps polyrhachis-furcata BCC 54312]|uniref:Peroxin 26 n=1 Tax=Ophiocordyceps polyrhachis-furcata BCC 54312 TaxID=1330021 RepID=A0A367LPG3_9HYPO|nr:hypothetical protein L249_2173 [Ophiocordyceps polyrhachis-furcata BCC 54312]
MSSVDGIPGFDHTLDDSFPRSLLSSSFSAYSVGSTSASSTAARRSSHVSKTYRQASTLFLTRRLPEALTTLTPLIVPAEDGEPAPVAKASRTTRIKVWSLYLTILHAVVEMEAGDGKEAFGNQEWRTLCAKVRDGLVWEEVVRDGYHGVEGDVDSDVVINLATLLLAHARDQTLNQRRLETYLATSNTPDLDLGRQIDKSPVPRSHSGPRYRSPAPGTSGADTPRDLNARVKILELYTLHVLLRNNEWDYAREFISVSSVLDDERREAFLQALESLQEEQQEQERLERAERRRQEEQLRRQIDDARRLRAENEEWERRRQDEARRNEADHGVERSRNSDSARSQQQRTSRIAGSSSAGKPAVPPTFAALAGMVLSRLRTVLDGLAASLNGNPALLARLLAFIVGLLVLVGHGGLRHRLRRVLAASWTKLKATAGMGTKISYI